MLDEQTNSHGRQSPGHKMKGTQNDKTQNGSGTFTAADGSTTLKIIVEGTGTPDLANPNLFLNFKYHVTFAGGSGQFTAARGEAEIKGAALFTSPSTG